MKLLSYIKEDTNRWKKHLNNNSMLRAGIKVLNTIVKNGHKAYIVGGAVRDIYLDHSPKDIDIATNMPMDELDKIWKITDIGKSKDFGIVVIKQDGHTFEIAQFRKDGSYSDGRRPDSVKISQSFKEDAGRRDFTFNAMAIDKDGNIIDHFNGKKDLKNKVVRTVGNPHDRFAEDHIRMMRAIRFSSRLGFDIDPETKDAIKSNKDKIKKVSIERVKDEIVKMAMQSGDKFADAIIKLDEVGILEIILPEVVRLKDFEHQPEHHPEGNPWEHTLQALRMNTVKDPIINLAILLHDIGKTVTYKNIKGKHTFHGHASDSQDLVDTITKRLKMSNKDRDRIMFAVLNHMKVHKFPEMKPMKILKLVHDENWETLQIVTQCDKMCRGNAFRPKEWQEVIDRIKEVEDKWGSKAVQQLKKYVDGNRVMKLTGERPGKKVGDIIKKATEHIINNSVKNDKEIDRIILKIYNEI